MEIDKQDFFCGFCGAQIELTGKSTQKKNKKVGKKIFLFFLVMVIWIGIILGLCTARGIIDWKDIIQKNEFQWTDISESIEEQETSKKEY